MWWHSELMNTDALNLPCDPLQFVFTVCLIQTVSSFRFILFVLSCFCCCCFVWFWLLLFWVVDLKHFFITLVSVAVTHHGFCFSPWNRSVFLWPVFTNQHTPLQLAASPTLSFRFHVSFRTVTATAPLRPPHSKLPLVIFSTGYQS